MPDHDESEILARFGYYQIGMDVAYFIHMYFPSNMDETKLLSHFVRVNKAFGKMRKKFLLIRVKGNEEFMGVAFNGSNEAHEILVGSLIKTKVPVRTEKIDSDEEIRLELLKTLKLALNDRVLTDRVEILITQAYILFLEDKKNSS